MVIYVAIMYMSLDKKGNEQPEIPNKYSESETAWDGNYQSDLPDKHACDFVLQVFQSCARNT